LERLSPEFRERYIETDFIGDLVAVDTFFVGHLTRVEHAETVPDLAAMSSKSPCNAGAIHTGFHGCSTDRANAR